MNELVSIITPLYNAEDFIGRTIESVRSQTYPHWEMIIVDDCSSDSSKKVVRKYMEEDERIKLVELEQNVGTGMAKNKALEHVNGKFIAFVDSDDWWLPEKLEKQVRFMKENQYPISYTAYRMVNADGSKETKTVNIVKSLSLEQYLRNTLIGFSTSMINIDITGQIGFMDLRSREDTQLWITLLKQGFKAYGLDEMLVKYRVHKRSITANRVKAARQTWRLYYRIEKLGLFRSMYYFHGYLWNTVKKHYKSG